MGAIMTQETKRESFETALERLQGVVKKLESGELGLEDSLKQFEEGVRLSKLCQEQLTAAEQKVELLLKAGAEGAETQPFNPGGTRGQ